MATAAFAITALIPVAAGLVASLSVRVAFAEHEKWWVPSRRDYGSPAAGFAVRRLYRPVPSSRPRSLRSNQTLANLQSRLTVSADT